MKSYMASEGHLLNAFQLGGIMILNAWMLISISTTLLSNLQLYHQMDYKHIVEQKNNGKLLLMCKRFFWYVLFSIQDWSLNIPLYQLFSDITKIFSVAETPLVVDVLPTLETLREGLIAARDDEENNPANVVRVVMLQFFLLISILPFLEPVIFT